MSTIPILGLLPAVLLIACGGGTGDASANPAQGNGGVKPMSITPRAQDIKVVATYPHDPKAWTQGLVFHSGALYEGTGQEGRSVLREVSIADGVVKREAKLDSALFGEGIAILGNRVYQITWQNKKGFVYELDTFKRIYEWSYDHEGWGLTHDGTHLILSDGTATLRFLNPRTFVVEKTLVVKDNGQPLDSLNELEMVKGELYANVWQTDSIVRIDPATGNVNGWINLAGLLTESERNRYQPDVLNGIAYDSVGDRLFVTGKLWPKIFEIKLVPQE